MKVIGYTVLWLTGDKPQPRMEIWQTEDEARTYAEGISTIFAAPAFVVLPVEGEGVFG